MLGFVRQAIGIWKWKRSPLGQALSMHTRDYFYSQTALSSLSQQGKDKLISDFYSKVFGLAQSSNSALELRTLLAEYVLLFAQLQVLCLTEEEKAQAFYKDNPYISGELWRQIEALCEDVDELACFRWETPDVTKEDLISFANARCALYLYYANGLNMVRLEIGDKADKDWFRPFVEAMLVWHESSIREKHGLPQLVPGVVGGLTYSAFMNYVVDGLPNPFFEWVKNFPDHYLAGEGAGARQS